MAEPTVSGGGTAPAVAAPVVGGDARARGAGAVAASRRKLDALTALRFFAAAFIVIEHAAPSFNVQHALPVGFSGGQGVTFFYVLSGFILTYSYPALDGSGVRRFYAARIARVWPMHLAAIALLILLIVVGQNIPLDPPVVILNVFLLQTWVPIPHVYGSFNPIAWSVSVELFFYACFPLLLRNWRRTWAIKLAVTFLMLVGMVALYNYGRRFLPPDADVSGVVYINPLARLFEFTLGIATAHLWMGLRDRVRMPRLAGTAVELAVIWVAFSFGTHTGPWSLLLQPLPFVGFGGLVWLVNGGIVVLPLAVLVLVFALEIGWLSRLLAFAPLVLLGEISYSIYLTHATFLGYYITHQELFRALPDDWLWPAYWVVVVAACFVFWSLIELPCRRAIMAWYDRHFSREAVRRRPVAAMSGTPASPWLRRMAATRGVQATAVALLLAVSLAAVVRASDISPSVEGRTRTDTGMQWAIYINGNDANAVGPIPVARTAPFPVVSGWAVDRTNGRTAEGVLLSIDGAITVPMHGAQASAEVMKQLNDARYFRAGFKGTLPVAQLAPGDHVVTLRILSRDGRTYYESRKFGIRVL